jgi:hypothetical protein
VAYLRSVEMGLTKNEMLKAAEKARGGAKQPKKPAWVPNPQGGPAGEYLVVGASDRGVILADQTTMPWVQAAKLTGRLRVEASRRESLLDKMRRIYVQANGDRPQIAMVGKALAA